MKGNALLGQSGGPTSVINSSLLGLIEGALDSDRIDRVLGMRYGIEGYMEGRVTDLGKETRENLSGLKNSPGSALGSCRYKLKDADLPKILELFKKQDIRYYFLIGGNDTMDTIHRIESYCQKEGYELFGVGVPKTVDNDLFGTDHTPGYPSAARYVAISALQAGMLARDMQRVDRFVIHQTVGREAGWLAASSAAARVYGSGAPHLLCLPEKKLNPERFLADVKDCVEREGWAYVCVGEGILWEDGTPVSAPTAKDKFSNMEFGAMGGSSAAINLHQLIHKHTGYRGEFQITESLPMCAQDRASVLDIQEAYDCGRQAVAWAVEGKSGVMVTIERLKSDPYQAVLGSASLSDVAVRAKPMPENFLTDNGVTDAFIEYVRPLVGELPAYATLDHAPF